MVLAHGADRPENAGRLRVLGLAEWLPVARWQADAVAALIARVLAEPAYRQRAVALAPTMDTTTAATRACAHLEDMVGQTAPLTAGWGTVT